MALTAGTRIGRYVIDRRIGSGGMGEVYLAKDPELGRKVAIKVLAAELLADETAKGRLLREARAAATLDHPNICSIYEVGEAERVRFIAMQFIDGNTLDSKIKAEPIRVKEAVHIAAQLADALTDAHAKGIIHRDIKPANVMFTSRGEVKMMDFGLAKMLESKPAIGSEAETAAILSAPGTIIGTVPYMSPEQVRGKPVDARSDIFSFGVLLYEMLSGVRPFERESSADTAASILRHEPPPLARYVNDIPSELERIVSKALHKEPDERYQTSRDLLIDLRTLRDDLEFRHRLERSGSPDTDGVRPVTSDGQAKTKAISDWPTTITQGEAPRTDPGSFVVSPRKLRAPIIAIVAVLIAALSGWWYWGKLNRDWASEQVPRIEELAATGNYFQAYDLAAKVQKYLPNDPVLTRLMPTISDTLSVTSDPVGAEVYLTRFAQNEAGEFPPAESVGMTPIKDLRIARGQYLLSVEREGFAKTERTISGAIMKNAGNLIVFPPPIRIEQKLIPAAEMPEGMVFVPGSDYRLAAWARPTDTKVRLDDFFVDKYEVSNRDYKEFIAAGGYLKRQFWKFPFVKDGKTLSWEEAMNEFKGPTGLPEPRGWSNQNFPDGKADYPVTDISWYEAAAYAEFRGKQLPTVYQWEKAARNEQSSALGNYMPWGIFYPGDTLDDRANFGAGVLPVNSSQFGMSPFGAYNMAGNVSEWTRNESLEGFFATGGSWGDPVYTFAQYSAFPGFYRSEKRGFRCALVAPGAAGDQGGGRLETKEEIPVYPQSSEADFKIWAEAYKYADTPLEPQIVEVIETDEWRREKITFNGADGERAIAYLYLPKNFPRPLQVIHIVPAGDVEGGLRSLSASIEDRLAPIIKSGRAVFGVVLKGYIERLWPEGYVRPQTNTVEFREVIVNRITDSRRGLDYLGTREDIDSKRIAYFGPSAGSRIGLILAAVENRYASVLLQGAGVRKEDLQAIAEANTINFAPHIKGPKLISNGRFDEDSPLKTQCEPLFKLLREPKRLNIWDGGHVPPTDIFVNTMNGWLDETLGKVRRE